MSLSGQSILVTGAAQGVGRGIALAAAAAGASVTVTARRIEAAEAVVDEITSRGGAARAVRCNVADRADVDAAVAAAVAAFGKLSGIVHNAVSSFSSQPITIETVTDENWDDQVAVAFRGSFYCAQAGFPHLRDSRGSLVILTSNAGIEGSMTLPVYAATKGAQRGLVKSLAREWGGFGIRVNAVAPVALTPAMDSFFQSHPHMVPVISNRAALGRIGDCEADIGSGVNFLLGNDSRFVTGQTLVLTGGAYML